jgi:hypothetical protein
VLSLEASTLASEFACSLHHFALRSCRMIFNPRTALKSSQRNRTATQSLLHNSHGARLAMCLPVAHTCKRGLADISAATRCSTARNPALRGVLSESSIEAVHSMQSSCAGALQVLCRVGCTSRQLNAPAGAGDCNHLTCGYAFPIVHAWPGDQPRTWPPCDCTYRLYSHAPRRGHGHVTCWPGDQPRTWM